MEWTAEEIDFLKKNKKFMSHREIGEHLGRTRSSVRNKWDDLREKATYENRIVGKVSAEERSVLSKLRKWLR